MKTLVIINGQGTAGKDSFVRCCCEIAPVANISSIDCVKERAKDFGWNGGKSEKDRWFLHELKKISTIYNDYSFRNVAERLQKTAEDLIFVHVREINEIERYVKTYSDKYNVVTLLIRNRALINVKFGNEADDNVFNYQYDFVIDNDGDINQLKKYAGMFMAVLGYERDEHK